jgi:hypothetical protein
MFFQFVLVVEFRARADLNRFKEDLRGEIGYKKTIQNNMLYVLFAITPWFVYRAYVVRIPCLRGSYTVPTWFVYRALFRRFW